MSTTVSLTPTGGETKIKKVKKVVKKSSQGSMNSMAATGGITTETTTFTTTIETNESRYITETLCYGFCFFLHSAAISRIF